MATYSKRPSLSAEILGPYASEGFDLDEKDDHVVQLAYNGNIIAVFNQMATTRAEIQKSCQEYLKGGDNGS